MHNAYAVIRKIKMKKLLAIGIAPLIAAGFATAGLAGAVTTVSTVAGCPGTYSKVVHVAKADSYSVTMSNLAVIGGGADEISVTGNNDCVLAGTASDATLHGNNGYLKGKVSELHIMGTGGTVKSDGSSEVFGGGNLCLVNPATDDSHNCKFPI
jgi:hypothetical protein